MRDKIVGVVMVGVLLLMAGEEMLSMRKRLAAAESEQEESRALISTLSNRIDELESEAESTKSDLEETTTKTDDLDGEIDDLKSRVDELEP